MSCSAVAQLGMLSPNTEIFIDVILHSISLRLVTQIKLFYWCELMKNLLNLNSADQVSRIFSMIKFM